MSSFRLDVYVPSTHTEAVKAALFDAGAGRFGAYDRCCFTAAGVGQFRPLPGAQPFLGAPGRVETVAEDCVSVTVFGPESLLRAVIEAMRAAHPYEVPAFQWWPVHTTPP
jgi:hypothetical protein